MNTESVLNRRSWVDKWGNINNLEDLESDYLRNILFYLYKNRDRYWFKCEDSKMIERFENGDHFFQAVIRKSNLWVAIIELLEKPEEGFEFEIDFNKGGWNNGY